MDAACNLYVVPEPARLKRDRVGQLHAHIVGHPAAVPEALRRIDADGRARQLLAFILAQGGVVKKGEITKQFGPNRGDGFWWRSDPPHSPLGRLRLAGLVFVGRITIDDRGYKVAVVPADLRPLLAEALG